jgi:hypothetical protein
LFIGNANEPYTNYDSGIELLEDMVNYRQMRTGTSNFFRRELLNNQKIHFSQDTYNDDMEFTLYLLSACKRVTYLRENIYVYFHRQASSISSRLGVEFWVQYMQILKRIIEDIKAEQKYKIWDKVDVELAMSCVSAYRKMDDAEKQLFDKELQKDQSLHDQFCNLLCSNSNRGRYFNIKDKRMKELKQRDDLYIYGARIYAGDLNGILIENGVDIKGFIESDLKSEKVFMNKKVFNLSDVDRENSTILIGVSAKYYDEILEILNRGGYKIFQI